MVLFLGQGGGEVSARVLRELEDLVRYYRPVECHVGNNKVDCFELTRELFRKTRFEDNTVVCNRRKNVCLRIARDSELSIQEISGSEVYIQIDVGDYVRLGDLIAYVITNKGEVRSHRSGLEGYVVLLHEDPTAKPLRYFIVVVKEGVSLSGGQ